MPISNPIAFYDQAVKYTPVVPRVLELNNVAVPTTGQIYQLTGVPSDRPILALLQIYCGLASQPNNLSVTCEPVSSVQSVPQSPSNYSGIGDSVSAYNSAGFYISRSTVSIPTSSGQIYLARNGNYLGTSHQTSLWTLGYWEGVTL